MKTNHSIIAIALMISSTQVTAQQPPDAEAYAREIVASHGGPARLLHMVKFTETYHLNGNLAQGTDRTSVLVPPRLWFVGTKERVAEENKGSVCADVWMWTLAPLLHPATKLEFVPEIVVEGKRARGLKVSGSIEPPINAYFDAATFDLRRIDWNEKQFLFSQPVAVSGTRMPSGCVLIGKDGKEIIRTELRDVQRLEELPAELGRVEGDTLFFTGESKATATAQLLRVPSVPPRLASANGTQEFEAGRDFVWQPGSRTVTLTAESRVPFKTTDELHPPANSPNAYKQQRGTDRWMFFGPGRVVHDLQCVASYASADNWRVPLPAAAPSRRARNTSTSPATASTTRTTPATASTPRPFWPPSAAPDDRASVNIKGLSSQTQLS